MLISICSALHVARFEEVRVPREDAAYIVDSLDSCHSQFLSTRLDVEMLADEEVGIATFLLFKRFPRNLMQMRPARILSFGREEQQSVRVTRRFHAGDFPTCVNLARSLKKGDWKVSRLQL